MELGVGLGVLTEEELEKTLRWKMFYVLTG